MKQLPIKSDSFTYILASFKEWLDIQGYAPSTVYTFPNHVREFFHDLEITYQLTQVQQIKPLHFKAHYKRLKQRTNTRFGGGLSNASLNKHVDALMKFAEYLRKSARLELPYIKLQRNDQDSKDIDVVSVPEIKALFLACDDHAPTPLFEILASRDKALLTVFYSCGLRRNEAYHLDLSDINFDRQVLHVRKGKNYKERFVPFNKTSSQILQTYMYDYRPQFNNPDKSTALFLSSRGKRMSDQTMNIRLKILILRTSFTHLHQKTVSLHTLRHSIATHLLDAGMSLENISRFLGHTSLESTQIYTHLAEQDANL
jgi:integrase/recombinase XerD